MINLIIIMNKRIVHKGEDIQVLRNHALLNLLSMLIKQVPVVYHCGDGCRTDVVGARHEGLKLHADLELVGPRLLLGLENIWPRLGLVG